jgi:Putative auto-transporter adhesin, head GIN domain
MKKIITMLLAAATMLNFSSCKKVRGEGPVETENRAINNFSGICTNIEGKVYFTQSPNYKVEIKAQRNIIDIIEAYKSGNDLILRFKNSIYVSKSTDIVISISAPALENLQLSGSGNVYMQGNFTAPHFSMAVSGSGNLFADNLQISNTLTAKVSGSGNIKVVNGQTKKNDVSISGSGDIDLLGLKADDAVIRVSGSGNTKIYASQTLNATISGSGKVYYSGNPVITTHISGSGKVVRI